MIKWCDQCPQELNSCDECNKKSIRIERVPKVTREEKRRLRDKVKQQNKR